MANYVIGDVQGCFDSLKDLLTAIEFSTQRDTLWFAGDLINRGPRSLDTLRFLVQHQENVRMVLGNHDIHLLALWAGYSEKKKPDTLDEILIADDGQPLIDWLRQQPLVLELPMQQGQNRRLLVHAGILPNWSFDDALSYSEEVRTALTSADWHQFMSKLFGNQPLVWNDNLDGIDRLRMIVNTCTRMRVIDPDYKPDFKFKMQPELAPEHLKPWFDFSRKSPDGQIFFGHWSALSDMRNPAGYCLDTGCVWGGKLTAMRLEDGEVIQVEASETSQGQ